MSLVSITLFHLLLHLTQNYKNVVTVWYNIGTMCYNSWYKIGSLYRGIINKSLMEKEEENKKIKKPVWKVEVDPRLYKLTEEATQIGSYSSISEFIRSAVRRRIKELLPNAKL